MSNRERILAVLNYEPQDRMPVVHFGFWHETLAKWAAEGHLTGEEARTWGDGTPSDVAISRKLGFDCNFSSCFSPQTQLQPAFECRVVKEFPDGSRHRLNRDGVVVLESPGGTGIPAEIDHLLKGRAEWEEHYRPRYNFHTARVSGSHVRADDKMFRFDEGGQEFLQADQRDYWYGLHCGSLFGHIRDVLGVENCAYLLADDEALFDEIIQTVGELCYQTVKATLSTGAKFDFAHFWEDLCYKNGPLITPSVFHEKVGPQYKRITALLRQHGINIISVDCDGMIDSLIPTWFENGVNTMFPIEVGTWNASIAPWRKKYGKDLRGVGGMNKNVFAGDRAAIDKEIERLKPLVELGGYIPCPDHRIPPDADWNNVRYYCDQARSLLSL